LHTPQGKSTKTLCKKAVKQHKVTKINAKPNNFRRFVSPFSVFVVPLRRHYELMAHFKPIFKKFN
jgi:hypothetical protein